MHLQGQVFADVAEMPGFGAVAGDWRFVGGVAQDEAVFIGVGGGPLAFGGGAEAVSDTAAATGDVDGQSGLVLAETGAGTLAVSLSLAVVRNFLIIDAYLCSVRAVSAGGCDGQSGRFGTGKHAYQGRRGFGAHHLAVADRCQILWGVINGFERMVLVDDHPDAIRVGHRIPGVIKGCRTRR